MARLRPEDLNLSALPRSPLGHLKTDAVENLLHYGYSIEIDHIVPLELGASNSIANLFLEPGRGSANYHVKDRLENRLHDLVCSGSVSLHAARLGIARNRQKLYRTVFQQAP